MALSRTAWPQETEGCNHIGKTGTPRGNLSRIFHPFSLSLSLSAADLIHSYCRLQAAPVSISIPSLPEKNKPRKASSPKLPGKGSESSNQVTCPHVELTTHQEGKVSSPCGARCPVGDFRLLRRRECYFRRKKA